MMITAEFGSELEAERLVRLRRRFLWYTGTIATISSLGLLKEVIFADRRSEDFSLPSLLLALTSLVLYVVAWIHVRHRRQTRWPLLEITTWLIVASGTLTILAAPISLVQTTLTHRAVSIPSSFGKIVPMDIDDVAESSTNLPDHAGEPLSDPEEIERDARRAHRAVWKERRQETPSLLGGLGLVNILVTHFLACAFLPWTARESIRPILPLLVINAGVTLIMLTYLRWLGMTSSQSWIFAGTMILFSPLVASPGTALCWWRHSRFRDEVTGRLVRGRYAEMRRELTDARRIHESLFPKMLADGPITFSYVYEPMRQIGGDYLYAQVIPGESKGLHLVIMDVTGHGIPAALTVNRLHGELQRIFAEQPTVAPGEVLRLLNRYVNLTMADHALFVTALCLRVDPARQKVEYASGGHPPAYIRTVDGFVHELPATTYLLGAEADQSFQPGQAEAQFRPGDRIAAFTDGAIEARGPSGKMIGLAGMRALIAKTETRGERHWAAKLLQSIDQFRAGPPSDDTLVVEIGFSLQSAPVMVSPPSPIAAKA